MFMYLLHVAWWDSFSHMWCITFFFATFCYTFPHNNLFINFAICPKLNVVHVGIQRCEEIRWRSNGRIMECHWLNKQVSDWEKWRMIMHDNHCVLFPKGGNMALTLEHCFTLLRVTTISSQRRQHWLLPWSIILFTTCLLNLKFVTPKWQRPSSIRAKALCPSIPSHLERWEDFLRLS